MNKVAIIGGSGFVGTRLIENLDNNYCFNIDKRNSQKFPNLTKICDIRCRDLVDNFPSNIDTVVLLAAEHRDDVSPTSLYYSVNVQGTINVIKSMEINKIKNIIFTSSVAVYGLNKENPDESHIVDPFNHYGKSKYQAEKVLHDWYTKEPENRSVTIIRPTVIFGEGNRGNVYNLLKQIVSGKFLMIGKGTNKKSMAYVSNVAEFIKYHIDNMKPQYQVLNYVDKPDYSMNELVNQIEKSLDIEIPSFHLPFWMGIFGGKCFDLISKITGKYYSVSSIRIKKFCATTQFDAKKAHSTGFKAPYTLDEGLHKTLQYEFDNSEKK